MDISFTNSSLFMVVTVLATSTFFIWAISGRGLVPGRAQSLAEMTYEFVAGMLRDSAGSEGMKFFPLVFSLFLFILIANMFGMFPYFFTVTSHIIITVMLAMLVFLTVILYGLYKHGLTFFKIFVPSGVPGFILPKSLSSSFREHVGRSHHTQGIRRLYSFNVRSRCCWCCGRHSTTYYGGRYNSPRIPGRIPAGLCIYTTYLYVS